MKNAIFLFIVFLLLNYSNLRSENVVANNNQTPESSITVLSTPDLFNLATNWASEYRNLNPSVNIKIINFTGNKTTDILSAGANLCFISNEYYTTLNNKSAWNMVVGRDAIVPVINSKNPFLQAIYNQGISAEKLAKLFMNPENRNWGSLLSNGQNVPVNYYMIDNELIKTSVANFTNVNQNSIDGIKVASATELILAIQKDPNAIGFSKLINIIDASNQNLVANINLLPIDRNNNGTIDYGEKIYDNLQAFMRGVWIGKYPKALTSNIYAVAATQPSNENEVAFLKWILTDGQQLLNANGFYDLVSGDRETKIEMLSGSGIYIKPSNTAQPLQVAIMVLVTLTVLFFVIGFLFSKKKVIDIATSIAPSVFNENTVKIPNGLYFDKTHTWAFMEKDGNVRVGIDDFLQHATGQLTRIKMKSTGEKVKKGEHIVTIIQNGKQLNINAPISGTIMEQNELLATNASLLNASPYSGGWIYMIEPSNWLREIQFFVMADKYKEWLKNEITRLKDFLAIALKASTTEYAFVTLQDGGELKDNTLAELGPDVWEDFQTNFIDTSK